MASIVRVDSNCKNVTGKRMSGWEDGGAAARQRNHLENPRADAFGDTFDDSIFAGCIAAFER